MLVDLQKAFDTISHELVFNKMEFLGISKDVIFWFKSYLSNRKFKVNFNKTFSEPGKLLYGVPQGSIVGPLLFLLYINDMSQAIECELLLYADDTCLIFQQSDINEIEIRLNKNFTLICDWFVDNNLSIHFGEEKTKSILFSNKCKIKKASPSNIQYKGKKVKQYSKVTYLLQQIVYTMRSSVGHGYARIQKFNTLLNIPKQMTVKAITKTFKKG